MRGSEYAEGEATPTNMIITNQFKNGLTILHEGKILQIIEFQHIKPGKGGAFVRTKLRNLKNNTVVDRTFKAGQKFDTAYIEQRKIQYLYNSGDTYFFMNTENFEEINMDKSALRTSINFLKGGLEITASYCKDKLIDVSLPTSVELRVKHTEAGVRGDTAKATYKPATLETGAVIQVPLFIKPQDLIKVDTRTGKYTGRV